METTIKNEEGFKKVILYTAFSTKMSNNMFLWFENNNQLAY